MCETTFLGSSAFTWFIGYAIILSVAIFVTLGMVRFFQVLHKNRIAFTKKGTYMFNPKEDRI